MANPDFMVKEHGYVILSCAGAFLLHMWLSFKVHARFNICMYVHMGA
jgi:hypothetical protein